MNPNHLYFQSSIRHNLSQHKIFVKELPPPSLKSKGSFWALDRRMAEKDLLLQIQPKRPRLSRISVCYLKSYNIFILYHIYILHNVTNLF